MNVSYQLRLARCIDEMSARRDVAVRNYAKEVGAHAAEDIRCFYQDRINQMQNWLDSERRGWELGNIEPCLREFEQLANPQEFRRDRSHG